MKVILLAGVAAAALYSSNASAQTAPAASQASDTPAAESSAQGDIVVTGLRASIQRAQDLKRKADSVVEAVTFEDLGKFSDQNIADALQRVPGVQIIRDDSGGSGDRASVRGLGSQYLQTTINGRTVISVGNSGQSPGSLRSFNLDSIPTEVIAGMTLYKTPTAQIVEPGLAGELDITTLRPLDYKAGGSFFGSILVRGEEDNLAKELRPRFSGVLGAKLFNDTLGIFVSGIVANTRTQIQTITLGPYSRGDLYFADPNGGAPKKVSNVLTTPGGEWYDNDFTRRRRTVSGGIQWKPASNLEIYGDFTYNNYQNNQERQHTSLSSNGGGLYGSQANPIPVGAVTIENGAVVGFNSNRNGTLVARYNLDGPRFNKNETESKYGGLNVRWSSGPVTLTGDWGHSDSKYWGTSGQIYSQDIPLDFVLDSTSGLPHVKVNSDINVPLQAQYYYNEQRVLKANRDSFRLDGAFQFATDWTLKLGVRQERSTVDSRAGSTFIFMPQANLLYGYPNPYTTESFGTAYPSQTFTPAEVAALDKATYPGGTFTVFPELGLPAFPRASLAGFCSVATTVCGLDIRNGSLFKGAFPVGNIPNSADATNPLQFSPLNSIYARENDFAVYGSIDGKTNVAGVPVDGNLGVRAVRISLFSRAFSSVRTVTADGALEAQNLVPTSDSNRYWSVLPNLNLNAHPAQNINLRFGVAKSISLPEYADTAPSGILTIYDRNSRNYNPLQHRDFGSFGSTKLKPMSAWNYDLTFEYYTRSRGAIIASLFYKDISNFILTTTTAGVVVPGQSVPFEISGPINLAKAKAKGFEIGFNQPFTFLPSPFDGFGLQANYTYVDTKIDSTLPVAQFGIPGTSKHNANLVAYYEKYGLGVRLGLTHRSKTLLATGIDATIQEPVTNLDLNLTYAVTKHIELNGSIVNITGQNSREYIAVPEAMQNYYQRPTQYSFGVRFSF